MAAAAADALTWLLGYADPERGVGWNPRSPADPFWKPGRTRALLDLAGAPDRRLRIVTIAGTNGKGSTGALIEAVARAAGLRVGAFSQPHLHDFRERWRLDGAPVPPGLFAESVAALRPLVAELAGRQPEAGEPTAFELTVVLAALAFQGTDLALFEVGLGGRLDAVNALHPSLTVTTSIGLDHVHILGGSMAAIAREKAAVMRPGVVALSAVQPREAERELRRAAERLSARRAVIEPLAPAGKPKLGIGQPVWLPLERSDSAPAPGAALPFGPLRLPERPPDTPRPRGARSRPPALLAPPGLRPGPAGAPPLDPGQLVTLALLGPHQRQNAALAVATARELGIPEPAIARGLATARWPGRLEWVPGDPPLLLDGAHNPDGARALAAALAELAPRRRYALVFGCARDKDAAGLLRPLVRRAASVWAVAADEPRAADPAILAASARPPSGRAEAAGPVAEGIARARASGAELVVVAGSLRVVAEAREEVLA